MHAPKVTGTGARTGERVRRGVPKEDGGYGRLLGTVGWRRTVMSDYSIFVDQQLIQLAANWRACAQGAPGREPTHMRMMLKH